MFNDTRYTQLYHNIIAAHTTTDKLGEKHHIIPKSLGGGNEPSNIVRVTARAHYILHKLLPKMVDLPQQKQKMHYALWRMVNPQTCKHSRDYTITSRDYVRVRNFVRSRMLENNPMKNPETAAKFSHKRPEQSGVATARNLAYWATRKLPMIQVVCDTCHNTFTTNNTSRICCSKSCAAKYRNKVRRLG